MAMVFIGFLLLLPCIWGGNDQSDFILKSASFPDDDRFAPPIGNGYLATNVFSDAIYVDGVFNGYRVDSHRARIPSTASLRVVNDVISEEYSLDMWNGVFIHRANLSDCEVETKTFAHRLFPTLLIVLVKLTKTRPYHSCLNVRIHQAEGKPTTDFNLSSIMVNSNYNSGYRYGPIRQPETNTSILTSIHHFWTLVPASLSLNSSQESQTFKFVTSIHTNKTESSRRFTTALSISSDELYWLHCKTWQGLWGRGKIKIFGDDDLQKTINACFYHILSSLPAKKTNSFYGLSPGGLSRGGKLFANVSGGPHNDYAGHVFWDMDTWIMPPIMMFFPDMARTMIGSRLRVLPVVKKRAQKNGYQGAQFPWEQAFTGYESCPWKPASDYQIHVTADVALSIRHYLAVSSKERATELLNSGGKELTLEIARFWMSRVTESVTGDYVITGVMGPDEYHFNINNSIFTNYNAKLSLELPHLVMKRQLTPVNKTEVDEFLKVSNKIRILYDQQKDFHPQYDGFSLKEKIKQSDVVLLGFPLQMNMSKSTRRNDLEIYENVTDKYGPDTGTWSMHTVGWLELDQPQRAHQNFKMMFRNINGPFKVFSEKPVDSSDGPRCVNFITAAGGLLQAVVFGYGGLRLKDDHLEVSVSSILRISTWAMYDLKYRGFTFDLQLNDDKLSITVTDSENQNKSLAVLLRDGSSHPLHTGKVKSVLDKAIKLRVEESKTVVDNYNHNSVQTLKSSGILLAVFNLLLIL
ncbi:protein-glucosylgalactosylhydroxylysine glucosidase-like isoform X1 [Ostrea edulis]|uniref:protein-glucosylgalactosylhydroxylysine glucosidase-like isoform X1 n=1 Tax=Ostrea edulis TaxID=37623 RepID=UPI0024AF1C1D|nr:protein-glucosylgalactosylhydroxylysine glucosidase-like isoform X1 [Ostrea edulis]